MSDGVLHEHKVLCHDWLLGDFCIYSYLLVFDVAWPQLKSWAIFESKGDDPLELLGYVAATVKQT